MTDIKTILQNEGPMMSSEVARRLEAFGIVYNTASQMVSRAKDILKIKGFFKSQQALCYLPHHNQDEDLYNALSDALLSFGKKYWYTLNALKMHGGIVSRNYLECYTNYPIMELKKHIPFSEVMKRFVEEDVLVFNGDSYNISPKLEKQPANSLLNRTIEHIKDQILADFKSYTRNIGLISYDTGELFAEYGKFRWGFKGVSPIIGLRQNDKFGFLLADVLIGKAIYKRDVEFFISKLDHIQSFQNASRLMPFLIVDNLETEAFLYLKQHGVVVGIIKEIFGAKYADLLRELVSILTNAGASLKANPNQYLQLIEELKNFNVSFSKNIKGTLFEYLVAHIHSTKCRSIDIGREIVENSSRHEMDVFALYHNKVVIAECKGIKGKADAEMVDKFLRIKIPAFRNWLKKQETLRAFKVEFEFWSTGGFDDEAKQKLDEMISATSKFKVSYFDAASLRREATEMKNKKLKEALDNYFLNPLI